MRRTLRAGPAAAGAAPPADTRTRAHMALRTIPRSHASPIVTSGTRQMTFTRSRSGSAQWRRGWTPHHAAVHVGSCAWTWLCAPGHPATQQGPPAEYALSVQYSSQRAAFVARRHGVWSSTQPPPGPCPWVAEGLAVARPHRLLQLFVCRGFACGLAGSSPVSSGASVLAPAIRCKPKQCHTNLQQPQTRW